MKMLPRITLNEKESNKRGVYIIPFGTLMCTVHLCVIMNYDLNLECGFLYANEMNFAIID